MLFVIAIVLFVILFGVSMWTVAAILKNTKKVIEDFMAVFLEVFYRQGYNDCKQGKPAQNWDVAVSQIAAHRTEKIFMEGFMTSYKEGYGDAAKDIFIMNEKIQKIRNEILEKLKKMEEAADNSRKN